MSRSNAPDWFDGWIEHHCDATAAGADAMRMLMLARSAFVEDWDASEIELRECTRRLIAGMRVPKFANEHSDAIGRELIAMRKERDRESVQRSVDRAEVCHQCDGLGWVEVPHPKCVFNGQLALHPDAKRIVTVSVMCECPEGIRQNRADELRAEHPDNKLSATTLRAPRRMTLDVWRRLTRGADGIGLLSVYRRKQVDRNRGDGNSEFAAVCKRILDRAREREGWP